jgi:hypothetical protein
MKTTLRSFPSDSVSLAWEVKRILMDCPDAVSLTASREKKVAEWKASFSAEPEESRGNAWKNAFGRLWEECDASSNDWA